MLDYSTDDSNTATGNGGGLYVSGGTAALTRSELRTNHAAVAGGIFSVSTAGGVVTLDHTDVQENSAPQCEPSLPGC
jgi:hypothetical protein